MKKLLTFSDKECSPAVLKKIMIANLVAVGFIFLQAILKVAISN